MRKIMLFLLFIAVMLVAGCNRGDLKITPVIEGQPAPHDGYNVGPELWVLKGQPLKVTGAVVWIRGVDPNSVFGQ